jgi:hypothetical protein
VVKINQDMVLGIQRARAHDKKCDLCSVKGCCLVTFDSTGREALQILGLSFLSFSIIVSVLKNNNF